jgi:hypothetical protein
MTYFLTFILLIIFCFNFVFELIGFEINFISFFKSVDNEMTFVGSVDKTKEIKIKGIKFELK